jgi:hypothetical protein
MELPCGGHCSRIIDLADDSPEYGGLDSRAKWILYPIRVRGWLRVGHTWVDDPSAPVWCWQSDDVHGPDGSADGRCPGCITRPSIVYTDTFTLWLAQHEPGCRWLISRLREAGLAA